MKPYWKSSVAVAVLSLGVSGVPAVAQAQTESSVNDDIIVTAQKREERLIDVPFAISAMSAEKLESYSATSLSDVANTVPGLFISNQGVGNTRTQIRGISNRIGVPTIGYYVDEAGVSTETSGQDIDVRFLDIQRVEVLRGPQGTLYGQGSLGGTIRFITADPDLEKIGGTFNAGLTSVAHGGEGYKINGVINLPLVEGVLGIRLLAAREKQGGWIDNLTVGKKDANSSVVDTFRGKLLWTPSAGFAAKLLVMHQRSRYDSDPASDNGRTIASPILTVGKDRYTLANLTLEAEQGPIKVVSSSTYLKRRNTTLSDITEILFDLEGAGFIPDASEYDSVALPSDFEGVLKSQELRFSSAHGGPFQWTLGLLYRDSYQDLSGVTFAEPKPLPFEVIAQFGTFASKSWAIFGEATYALTPEIFATAGLRYFLDDRETYSNSVVFGSGMPETNRGTFSTLNPRFNLSWRPNATTNLYVSASKGFRSGGFNITSAAPNLIPASYDVEKLWTYEAGAKVSLFNRLLDLETSVYYNDYSNVVALLRLPTRPINYRANAGAASGWGIETSFVLRPAKGFSVSGQINWNDLRFDENSFSHLKGDRLDFSPDMTASIAADYEAPLGDNLTALFHADYQHTDPVYITQRNANAPSPTQVTKGDTISTVNLRAGLRMGEYELAVFARNLFDENKRVQPRYQAFTRPIHQTPRTIGIEVRGSF